MSGYMKKFPTLLIVLSLVVSMAFSTPVIATESSLLEANNNIDFNKQSYNPDKQNVLMEMEWDSVFYMDEASCLQVINF